MSQSESLKPFDVDDLAQEIRRVDGSNSLGAGALAEALVPFITARIRSALATTAGEAWKLDREAVAKALHAVDCHDAEEEHRYKHWPIPEQWADPWHPSSIPQLEKLRRRADVFLAALVTDKG